MALIMRQGNNQFGDIIINDQILFDDWELEQNTISKAFEINNNGVNAISIADASQIITIASGSINSDSTSMFFAVGLVQQVRWNTIAAFFNRGIISLTNGLAGAILDTTGTDIRLSTNTTTGLAALVIDSSGNTEINDLTISSSGTGGQIQFVNSNSGTTSGDGTIVGLSSSTFIINNQEATNINLQQNGTTALAIESNGNVIIANELRLTTAKSMIIGADATPQVDLAIVDSDTGLEHQGTDNLAVFTGGIQRMLWDETGNVAIGTFSNPTITLAVGDSDTGLDQVSDGVLRIMTNAAERMRFAAGSGGVIGVGDDPSGAETIFDVSDVNPRLTIRDTRTNYGSATNVNLGSIEWFSNDASFDSGLGIVAKIQVRSANSSVAPDGKLEFLVFDNGAEVASSRMTMENDGSLDIQGTLTKDAGSFDITHPNTSMAAQGYRLRHCFVESNTCGDNQYYLQCEATTDNEVVEVDLPSYYKDLNENTRMFIQGVGHFGRAYGEINDRQTKLLITCELIGKYDILCIGTRTDDIAKEYFSYGAEYLGTRSELKEKIKNDKEDKENNGNN